MPVGISFWTFQGLSYLLDVYREEELDPSLLEFCLYMAFWPTVLSGPVCRLPSMLPQFRAAVGFSRDNFYAGARRVIQGLWMKMVLAQILGFGLRPGEGVIGGFDQVQEEWGGVDVWLLAIGFGFQLFFDFAGYSHMVIGTARIFGIRLAENFDRPYFSTTPSIFWTRWHMSLSFWIRDYVFLPLASSLRDRRWPYVALVLSLALFGLWHGAKATLILWGIYHGLLLVLHRLGQQLKRWLTVAQSTHLGTVMSWCATFSLVSLGWIFFRAHDLGQALTMLRAVLSPSNYYQFALPGSLYVLISSVVISYFLYEMLGPIVDRLRASYREELINYRQTRSTPSLPSAGFMLGKGCDFLAERKWWWATPMLAGFAAFCSLAIFHQNSPVTPFMYTLF
jgi:alginate O-acetyltransferase complex protein AlgI